jgi:hypothetical protein
LLSIFTHLLIQLSLPEHKGIETEVPIEPRLTKAEEEPDFEPRLDGPIEREDGPGDIPISS